MENLKDKIVEAINRVDSLEYILMKSEVLREDLKGDQLAQYSVGDIIMAPRFYSKNYGGIVNSPHRILVITAKKQDKGIIKYEGYELSSNISKSNKNSRYTNNLHIEDYSTIISRGKKVSKQAIIRVDDLVSFTNRDLSTGGSYKGTVTSEFMKFVQQAAYNLKSGKDNAEMYWE